MSESDSANSQNAPTDDLLAQLAGEEVDRLLADADVTSPPPAEKNEHLDEQETAALTSMLEAAAQSELQQVSEVSLPSGGPPVTPAAPEGEKDVSAQLDQLFAALTTSKKDDLEWSPAPPAPEDREAPGDDTEDNNDEAVALEEKAALGDGLVNLLDRSALPPPDSVAWWGRPLLWINVPFRFLSEKTRKNWDGSACRRLFSPCSSSLMYGGCEEKSNSIRR